jgi:hypothetical protein
VTSELFMNGGFLPKSSRTYCKLVWLSRSD